MQKQLMVRLKNEDYDMLQDYKRASGRTLQHIVREAINVYIEKYRIENTIKNGDKNAI